MHTSLTPIAQDIGRALAEMDFGTPPEVTEALAAALGRSELGYLGGEETGRLQRAVADWLQASYGWGVPQQAIRPVADLVAGFRAILAHFTDDGEPIIVPTPGYMPFLSVPPMIGRRVIEVPMLEDADGWRYDLAAIGAAFEAGARLLVLCNPHNPIGKVATDSELAELEELVDAHGGFVLADEIHAPLVIGEAPHHVYAARSARAAAHTITATSATKAFNFPGTKCGQLIFTNPTHLERWNRVGHWYEHQTSVLGVVATEAAYGHGRPWLDRTVEELRQSVAEGVAVLREARERTGIRVREPDATYLLWIDLRDTGLLRDGVSAARVLRDEAQLIVTDGADCGEAGRGFVRFNAAMPRERVREAMQRLVRAAERKGRLNAVENKHTASGRDAQAEPTAHATPVEQADSLEAYLPPVGEVTVFSAVWCGHCSRLKQMLSHSGVPFREVAIEQDPVAEQIAIAANGGDWLIPTVVFSDGTIRVNPSLNGVNERLAEIGGRAD